MNKFIVVSAPSGTGKNTIINRLIAERTDLAHSVSTTTRSPREGERHGKEYYFMAKPKFLGMVENDEFVEHAQILENFYGTSKAEIERIQSQGRIPILDIDVQGMLKMKANNIPMCSVFIMPPSLSELRHRLNQRGTEEMEEIARRLELAKKEIEQKHHYDFNLVNDRLDKVLQSFHQIIDEL